MPPIDAVGEAGAEPVAPPGPYAGRFRGRAAGPGRTVDLAPASAYDALTRQMVERLAEDLGEIKGRLDGLLFMVAGAIVLDVVMRLAGG